jgi:hypothetical protein
MDLKTNVKLLNVPRSILKVNLERYLKDTSPNPREAVGTVLGR